MDKRIIRDPVWKQGGMDLEILLGKKTGCYESILKATYGQMEAMLSSHSRMLVVRLDIRLYEYTGDNAKISNLLRRVKEWLADQYGMKQVGHIWVREMEKAKNQHYHLGLMLDGRKIQHPERLIDWIYNYCDIRGELSPHTPKNSYKMVRRGDNDSFVVAFRRLSYLAKSRGKGYKDKTANNYSVSRLRG